MGLGLSSSGRRLTSASLLQATRRVVHGLPWMMKMEQDLYIEALDRLRSLLERAAAAGLKEPAAMSLATVDAGGRPAVRVVLLRGLDERGLVFYTNSHSRKGEELAANPRAALCFFWEPLMEQVRVEGRVEPVATEEADAYWARRPRESQIGAWASHQSRPLESRATLEARFAECERRFAGQDVPRPAHWLGYRVIPERIEFWRSGPARLHERVQYEHLEGEWVARLLYP